MENVKKFMQCVKESSAYDAVNAIKVELESRVSSVVESKKADLLQQYGFVAVDEKNKDYTDEEDEDMEKDDKEDEE